MEVKLFLTNLFITLTWINIVMAVKKINDKPKENRAKSNNLIAGIIFIMIWVIFISSAIYMLMKKCRLKI